MAILHDIAPDEPLASFGVSFCACTLNNSLNTYIQQTTIQHLIPYSIAVTRSVVLLIPMTLKVASDEIMLWPLKCVGVEDLMSSYVPTI